MNKSFWKAIFKSTSRCKVTSVANDSTVTDEDFNFGEHNSHVFNFGEHNNHPKKDKNEKGHDQTNENPPKNNPRKVQPCFKSANTQSHASHPANSSSHPVSQPSRLDYNSTSAESQKRQRPLVADPKISRQTVQYFIGPNNDMETIFKKLKQFHQKISKGETLSAEELKNVLEKAIQASELTSFIQNTDSLLIVV
ncbi:hypothetical protein HELRODRAFT_167847 [Helobdella robusta]|uniref:Uncharacterized protein n=1 Tax=Helobdella robusta TaxID=6412 RepID=T1EZV5_HELRO|nr:hypothetical protein HELRODRAFT_167847 [Helobdella robusta]ESO10009.1 hypothetical protein HELRODRAFT_167847 [Helobdella robusta]